MSIKEKYSLELKCNCVACQTSHFGPTRCIVSADTREKCYQEAIRNGWHILRNRFGELLALSPFCLVPEENKKKFDLKYGLTEDKK